MAAQVGGCLDQAVCIKLEGDWAGPSCLGQFGWIRLLGPCGSDGWVKLGVGWVIVGWVARPWKFTSRVAVAITHMMSTCECIM